MNTDHHHLLPHHGHRAAGRKHVQRRHHPHSPAQVDALELGGARRRGGHPRGAGRGRAQRGDVRTALLMLLAEHPMHGYQLIQAITERTSGAWRPSPGAIYPTLNQLEDEGLIDTLTQDGRKLATLTNAGQAYLHSRGETLPDPFATFTARCPESNELRDTLEELRYPVRQLARGDSHQVRAALRVLTEARRSLYLLLAELPAAEDDIREV